jgi:hypothetical protein
MPLTAAITPLLFIIYYCAIDYGHYAITGFIFIDTLTLLPIS